MSNITPLNRRLPITLADITDEEDRVVIYCLCCGRSKTMVVYMLRRMVGPISLGTVNGRFACVGKGGCGKSIGIVLPASAPTPEAWARQYKPKASDPGVARDAPQSHFAFHVERWDSWGSRPLAQVTALEMANAAFELAVPRLEKLGAPYITIRHQGRVLRDSRRDFKLLPGRQGE